MPHVFLNRPRIFNLSEEVVGHFKWEIINTVFYEIGGFILLAGSVLFLPKYAEIQYIGSWLFVAASVFYLTVSAHDILEIFRHRSTIDLDSDLLDIIAATAYLIGAICFILGSLFFLPVVELFLFGAYTFIIGSILFVVGAVVNSIQIFDSPTRESSLYANLTAVSYVIGSTLYLAGSIPYLWDFDNPEDSEIITRYLAELFIVGSILFILGGTFNIYRAKLVVDHYLQQEATTKSEPSVE